MKLLIKNFFFLICFLFICVVFFWRFFFKGEIPLPADTIVGMYYPWRDVVWDDYQTGVPFKNFLITDPVRQHYLWKNLVIEEYKNFQFPLWNPYTHAGMPLLANFQTGAFYPLNLLFFIFPFNFAWGLYIFFQPLLGGIFSYWYLRKLKIKSVACLSGSLVFVFSGFMMAWLEWGNIGHTLLWLPLILLSLEFILELKKIKVWFLVFLLALVFQFFAGHLQTSFYLLIFVFIYLIYRLFWLEKKIKKNFSFLFFFSFLLFLLITAIQWLPTLELIHYSTREIDQAKVLQRTDWFLPWQHLVQLIAPDFFGNPSTNNYWGIWNYGEFVSFIGVGALFFVLLAIFDWYQNHFIRFFFLTALIFLSFALPTPWAKLPFWLKIPLLSTAQPSRLIGLVDFCLSVLVAFGFNSFLKRNFSGKKEIISFFSLFLIILILWFFTFKADIFFPKASWLIYLKISQRNLILPTLILFLLFLFLIIKRFILRITNTWFKKIFTGGLLLLLTADLLRFGWKFNSFSKEEWIFPRTKTIDFLKTDSSIYRIMSTDRRLFPANFPLAYRLQTISGYDPLYLKHFAIIVSQIESGKKNLVSFNRIIEPANYYSSLIDELNVKYILSLQELKSPKLKKVFQEGETKIYENLKTLPRFRLLPDEGEEIILISYQPTKIKLKIDTIRSKKLILADMFYPGWRVKINNQESSLFRTENNFRLINLIEGENIIEIFYLPKSFLIGCFLSLGGIFILVIFLKNPKNLFTFKSNDCL